MLLESKRNIKLTLSYDGTNFVGWQVQPNGRSVQGEIEKALTKLHGGQVIRLTGSGRTDSGVHATGQVANFYTEHKSLPSEQFKKALNGVLPKDIRVHRSQEVSLEFHSRYKAKYRAYRYYLCQQNDCPAHLTPYAYRVGIDLDLVKLNEMALALVGVQDFTSLAAAKDPNECKIREIYTAQFIKEGPFIVLHIAGSGFLWRMVRTIVGTLLEQMQNGGSYASIKDILAQKDRRMAGPSAPPQGLFLHKVLYESERSLY